MSVTWLSKLASEINLSITSRLRYTIIRKIITIAISAATVTAHNYIIYVCVVCITNLYI